jgi:hypothetical protein
MLDKDGEHWNGRVRTEEALQRLKEQIHTTKRNHLLKRVIEGKIEEKTKMTGK